MIEDKAIIAVFTKSLKLKPDESCLIVTDTIKERIGRAFYDYASRITPRRKLTLIEPAKEHAMEPPEDTALEMLEFDVELLITSKSLTHTRARRQATAKGARIVTMPDVTEEIINRCIDIDYDALREDSRRLYGTLKKACCVRVTTKLGTDIVFEVGGGDFFGGNGGIFDFPGAYGNLPEGEVSFAPDTCEGVYVVDASFPDLGVLDAPLKFKVKNGVVYGITGPRSAEIIERLNRAGPRSYLVAELGIGLNPKAIVTGNVLEDEKVKGTVHIAVGNNLSYGRDNDVPLHLDGVITKPDIYVDSKKIMEEGGFTGRGKI